MAASTAKAKGFSSYAQVLLPGQPGGAPGLLVFFNDRRYLINCAETTQRFASENKVLPTPLRDLGPLWGC